MELRENLLFETLKHDLMAALIVLDKDGNVVFINDKALSILYEQNIQAREFCKKVQEVDSKTVSNRKECEINDRIIGFSLKKVFNENSLNREVIIFKDITEIKNEEKIAKRKESMEVIGELTTYIAHEIKNSLNIIKGFSQLMSEAKEIGAVKNSLEILIDETIRLNKLTNNILDYTKIGELSYENTNLVVFLKDILEKTYSREKISLFCNIDDLEIEFDRDKIKQVFINIIQNGIEAIDEIEGIFNIYIEDETETVNIIFETNKEVEENFQIENIFSPYFTTKKNGNGLGLALCKKVVEDHNGTIGVNKNFYGGLTFTVSLLK